MWEAKGLGEFRKDFFMRDDFEKSGVSKKDSSVFFNAACKGFFVEVKPKWALAYLLELFTVYKICNPSVTEFKMSETTGVAPR